jgi:CRISPR-associated protein Cas2
VICLLIYDIEHDGLRAKVADACLDYGLARIQYSAFLGDLSRNRQGELLQKIRRLAGRRQANVQVFPICEKDMGLRRQVVTGETAGQAGQDSGPRHGAVSLRWRDRQG